MGILSEIDMMNRDAEDDAFEVSSDSETVDSFSEEFEPVEPQKPNQQAEAAEEARKKAEFDAAEVKRKAEWEAKQAQRKLREQQELDRLAAMSDDDVMQASMNRVSQDTERLTRLLHPARQAVNVLCFKRHCMRELIICRCIDRKSVV